MPWVIGLMYISIIMLFMFQWSLWQACIAYRAYYNARMDFMASVISDMQKDRHAK